MAVNITIKKSDIGPWILRFQEKLGSSRIHQAVASRYLELIRRHLRGNVAQRHKTAQRLGADPSGFWANAMNKTSIHHGEHASTITLAHEGMKRAFRDVTIRPKRAKALTLPMHALAYGRRPAEAEQTSGKPIFRPKGSRILAMEVGGKLTPMYLLSGAVFQKRDPTLLPEESAVTEALHHTIENEIERLALEATNQ